jgi:branched-subunit amino acid transport protein
MNWLILLIGGGLTYLTRISFIALFGKLNPSPAVQRGLRFVPPAVLTAIIFQELFIRDSRLALGLANPRPLIGLVAALVAWKTRSALWTIAIGALLMLVYQLVF